MYKRQRKNYGKTKGAVFLAAPFILLLEEFQVGITAVDDILPTIEGIRLSIVRLNYEHKKNCKAEYYACNESPLIKCSICISGLILTIEGLRTTCDSAGKTILITFLKNNCNNDKCSRNEKQYKKYDFKNFHFSLPFILFPNCVGMINTVILP